MSLWDSLRDAVVDTGSRLGNVAGQAALRTKLNTDLMLVDRELVARKQKFGVEMYDYVSPLSKNQAFYTSDDTLTLTLQPPLITAQREIAALEVKRKKQNDLIQQAAQVRASAFRPAESWTDKLANAGKSAALGGNEAKLKTELAIYNGQILHFKQEFGLQLYKTLEELEDSQQWLPTDREIRSIYDNCRRDIEKIQKRKLAKQNEIKTLMNGGNEVYDPSTLQNNSPGMTIQTTGAQPSVYAKPASDVGANQYPGQPTMPSQAGSMYPVAQQPPQQRNPAASMQQPQPAVRQQYNMQEPPQYQHQQQQQQQPAPVLHSNLFAGVVPGAVAPPAPAPAIDPFGRSMMQQPSQQQQQQQAADPFAAFGFSPAANPTSTAQQQPQMQHDPFANQFTPPPLMAPAPAPAAPPQDTYVDPFSGL